MRQGGIRIVEGHGNNRPKRVRVTQRRIELLRKLEIGLRGGDLPRAELHRRPPEKEGGVALRLGDVRELLE